MTEPHPKRQFIRARKMQPVQLQPRFPDENVGVGSCSSSKTAVNKFDVFINHRGPDTKHTMAYHLYDLFRDRGVQVFLDKEEFQGGDSVPVLIEEAINCCKVHVCIFSSRYAESAWCLEELEMILNRYEISTSLLIPIFYDVEPSDVRYLKGTFGQGFEKHRCRYSSEVIEKWRNVLFKASNINGYQGKGEHCMTIVNIVCKRLNAGSVATPEKVVGILDNVMKVKNNIMRYRNERGRVTLVEVSGVGGIGKTTFAKCLYNQIYTQFERHYFMEDVSGTIEKNGVDAVHKQLGNNLLRDDSTLCGSQLKQLLKERLQNADILLVLDNIIRENCLNVVFMDDYVNLAGASVIIVTSREKDVVKHNPAAARYNLMSLQISELAYCESKEIFCYYAFGGIHRVNTQFDNLMNKIISKCGGIPLALTLMGRHLYGKKIAFWEKFCLAINNSLPPDLKKILKFSYDSLETELEKCLFLDVAIFFHLESVDLLKKCRGKNDEDEAEISIALDNLQKKLLIDVRSGNLYMHDLLVDLCKNIVKDESSNPGHRSRLWNPLHVREVLSDSTGTDKVKGLSLVWKGEAVLDKDVNGDPCPWSAEAFAEMSSLEILFLNGDCIEGDFSRLSKRLLFLKWTNFPLQSIPTMLCLKSLRVLLLSHGRNIRLWDFSHREAPVNLRQLMVLECNKLQKLPEFTRKFVNLSSIKFDGLVSLESLPDSFGLLQEMKYLWLNNCMALKELPISIGNLKNLLELILQNSSELKLSSTSFRNLSQLKLLTLVNCPALEELPQTLGALQTLRGFVIEECCDLDVSEMTPDNLPRLRSLRVVNMRNLRKFSLLFGSLSRLEHLHLFKCQSLQEFPESLGNLSHLKYLYIGCCTNLEALPATVGNLKNLRKFYIQDCLALKGFPSTLGNLSALTLLGVDNCGRVDVIHTHEMLKLKNLFIINCGNLRSINGIDGCLQSLERVCVIDCDQLNFPDGFLCQQHNFIYIRLSLNEEFITRYSYNDFKKLSDSIIRDSNHYSMKKVRYSSDGSNPDGYHYSVKAKVSPCLFPSLKERVRHIVANKTSFGVCLYSANHHEQLQLPKGSYIRIICFISAVYAEDFADNIPPPSFLIQPHLVGDDIVKGGATFYHFNIGEQINFGLSFVSTSGEGSQASFKIRLSNVRRRIGHDYPVYKGIIKEGWMICVRKSSHVASDMALVREVNRAFYSELQYQRLHSRAWSQLPSQLCLFKFSALDVANCKITKTYRHCNTWIMKEETGLTWKRRKCLFSDDHALALLALLRNRKRFTFLVFNVSKYELQTVTNFYEMSVCILLRGKINHARKLQQHVSNSTQNKEIPHGLDTLLQSKSHDLRAKALDCWNGTKAGYIFQNDVYVQVKGGFSEGWKKYPWH